MKIKLLLIQLAFSLFCWAQAPVIYKRPAPITTNLIYNDENYIFNRGANTYTILQSGSWFSLDTAFVSFVHLSSRNNPLDTIPVFSSFNLTYIIKILKVFNLEDEALVFYERYNPYTPNYDSLGCLRYNFKTKTVVNTGFFVSKKLYHSNNSFDVEFINNHYVVAYCETTSVSYLFDNYYKVYDTAFHLLKQVPIELSNNRQNHRLMKGKNNTLYHLFYNNWDFSNNYTYKLDKMDTGLNVLYSNTTQDTFPASLPLTFALSPDSDMVYVTTIKHYNHDILYNDFIAVFKIYDTNLTLIKEGETNIAKNLLSLVISQIKSATIKYYNKWYMLCLFSDTTRGNLLLTFDEDFNLIKQRKFTCGSAYQIQSIWHTFYFKDKYYSYMLPLEETDGVRLNATEIAQNLYPNPTKGMFNIGLPGQADYRVKLFTPSGQQDHEYSPAPDGTVDVSDLPAGIYFVEIKKEGETPIKQKLVKIN